MDEHLAPNINRIGNTIANVSSEIINQADSVCARLDRIGENLCYINSAIDLSGIDQYLPEIEHALRRIAYALERKNEWEGMSRPTLAKSSN
jgi:hypothetical protein